MLVKDVVAMAHRDGRREQLDCSGQRQRLLAITRRAGPACATAPTAAPAGWVGDGVDAGRVMQDAFANRDVGETAAVHRDPAAR